MKPLFFATKFIVCCRPNPAFDLPLGSYATATNTNATTTTATAATATAAAATTTTTTAAITATATAAAATAAAAAATAAAAAAATGATTGATTGAVTAAATAAVTAAAIVAITEVAAVVAAAATAAAITQKAAVAVTTNAAPAIDFGSTALGDFGARIMLQIDIQFFALHKTLDLSGVSVCCLLYLLPASVPLLRLSNAAVFRLCYPFLVHFSSLRSKEGVSDLSFDICVTHNKRIHTHKVSDAHCLVLQVCSYRFESVACK